MAGDWKVDGARLWATGIATSVVAGLAATAVLVVARAFAGGAIEVALPGGSPADLTAVSTFVVGFVMGILATATLHLLLVGVPRGTVFFGWISTLVFILSLALPGAMEVSLESKAWLAAMHAVTFAVIVSLLMGNLGRVATPVRR